MTAILSDSFRVESAKILRDSIVNSTPTYMFIGKATDWPNGTVVNPSDSQVSASDSMNDMIFGKRLGGGNMTFAANRHDWTPGEVYAQYDVADSTLFSSNKKFYVITNENNVYKCLGNNHGAPSLAKPTGRSLIPTSTPDGYIWKYMFSISTEKAAGFMTSQYIPVTNDPDESEYQYIVKGAAISGAIESYIVDEGGIGYTNATVTVTGDGSGATALAVLLNGSVNRVLMVNPGSGYTRAQVKITGNGRGAVVRAQPAPAGGHGSNAPLELGAHYLMMLMEFGGEDSPRVPDVFSFRRVGLLMNPKNNAGASHSDFLIIGATKAYFNTVAGFAVNDTILFSDNTTGVIVNIGSDDGGSFMILSECKRFGAGTVIKRAVSTSTSATCTSVIPPDFKPNTGSVCYIENRNAIFKNELQTEIVRIIVEF